MKKYKDFIIMAILAAIFIAVDMLTKYLTDLYLMPLGTTKHIIPGIVSFTSVHNTGAAFGMFSHSSVPLLIFRIIACIGILFVIIRFNSQLDWPMRIAIIMAFSGAVGNIIDQLIFGYVRDMIEFTFVNFAVFNAADSFICIGAAIAIIDLLFGKSRRLLSEK